MMRLLALLLLLPTLAHAQTTARTPNLRVPFTSNEKMNEGLSRIDEVLGPITGGVYDQANRGKVFDAGGAVVHVQAPNYGARCDGTTDDTVALQKARDAVKTNGGTLVFPPGAVTCVISGDVGITSGSAPVTVLGNGATIQRASTGSGYTMFSVRSNVSIYDLTLRGHVTSGTGWADAVPQSGFGFRSGTSYGADRVLFVNVTAYNLSYDGWYFDSSDAHVTLLNCKGYDNYRADVVMVNGRSLTIDGGTFADDTGALTRVAAVDVEPDSGGTVESVVVRNVYAEDRIKYDASSGGTVRFGQMENISFSGSGSGPWWRRVGTVELANIQYASSAALQGGNAADAAQSFGRFTVRDAVISPGANLLTGGIGYNNNSRYDWTVFSSGSPTEARDVAVGHGRLGVEVNQGSGSALNFRKAVSVTNGTTYTFGCRVRRISGGAAAQGCWVNINAKNYYLTPNATGVPELMTAAFVADDTTATVYWGTNHTQAADLVITDVFLVEGLVNPDTMLIPDPLPPVPAAQTIAAGGTIAADACGGIKRISSAGSVTTDTTNTFTAPATANAGCVMDVCNSGANAIALDANSNFVIDASDDTLSDGDLDLTTDDCVRVGSDGSKWRQLARMSVN